MSHIVTDDNTDYPIFFSLIPSSLGPLCLSVVYYTCSLRLVCRYVLICFRKTLCNGHVFLPSACSCRTFAPFDRNPILKWSSDFLNFACLSRRATKRLFYFYDPTEWNRSGDKSDQSYCLKRATSIIANWFLFIGIRFCSLVAIPIGSIFTSSVALCRNSSFYGGKKPKTKKREHTSLVTWKMNVLRTTDESFSFLFRSSRTPKHSQ